MMTKTLEINDEVYWRLVSVKRKGESFDELFERLVDYQMSVSVLKTLRGRIELSKDEKSEFMAQVDRQRKKRRAS